MDWEKRLSEIPEIINELTPETFDTFEKFVRYKVNIGRKSLHTIQGYLTAFTLLFSHLETTDIKLISREMVLSWLMFYSVGKKPSTVFSMLSRLDTFFNYCVHKVKIIPKSPIRSCWRPKTIKLLPKYIPASDLAKICILAEQLPIRDHVLHEFLKCSGCRRSEIVGVNVSDIDFKNGIVMVFGKGRKHRPVQLSTDCIYLINEYLKEKRPDGQDALFLNQYGERISDRLIYRLTIELGIEAGLIKPLHPHKYRHSYATGMVERGCSILEVQRCLGHEDISSTMIYTFLFFRDIQLDYDKYMED